MTFRRKLLTAIFLLPVISGVVQTEERKIEDTALRASSRKIEGKDEIEESSKSPPSSELKASGKAPRLPFATIVFNSFQTNPSKNKGIFFFHPPDKTPQRPHLTTFSSNSNSLPPPPTHSSFEPPLPKPNSNSNTIPPPPPANPPPSSSPPANPDLSAPLLPHAPPQTPHKPPPSSSSDHLPPLPPIPNDPLPPPPSDHLPPLPPDPLPPYSLPPSPSLNSLPLPPFSETPPPPNPPSINSNSGSSYTTITSPNSNSLVPAPELHIPNSQSSNDHLDPSIIAEVSALLSPSSDPALQDQSSVGKKPIESFPLSAGGCQGFSGFLKRDEKEPLVGEEECGIRVCRMYGGSYHLEEQKCNVIVYNPNYTCVVISDKKKPFPKCCPQFWCND